MGRRKTLRVRLLLCEKMLWFKLVSDWIFIFLCLLLKTLNIVISKQRNKGPVQTSQFSACHLKSTKAWGESAWTDKILFRPVSLTRTGVRVLSFEVVPGHGAEIFSRAPTKSYSGIPISRNPQFPEPPDISNQTLFPLDLLHASSIISPLISRTLDFSKLPITQTNFGSRGTNWPSITGRDLTSVPRKRTGSDDDDPFKTLAEEINNLRVKCNYDQIFTPWIFRFNT